MSGPPAGSRLLDLLEPGWRRHLAAGGPAGTLDVEPEMLDAVALALGDLSRSEPPAVLNRRWPACIVVAVAQITARYDKNGKVWPAWFRATRTRAASRSAADWAEAFLGSLATLGVPTPAGDPLETVLADRLERLAAGPTGPDRSRLAGSRDAPTAWHSLGPLPLRAADLIRGCIAASPLQTKGPLLEATPPYRTGATLRDLIGEGVLDPAFARLGGPALPLGRPLYLHQEQALRKAAAGRNLVVATGTGSGKTESFLLPALSALTAEHAAGTLGGTASRRLPALRCGIPGCCRALAVSRRTRER